MKVVGAFAVVQFPNEGDAAMATRDRDAYSKNIDLPINCRLIKKVDLQVEYSINYDDEQLTKILLLQHECDFFTDYEGERNIPSTKWNPEIAQ